VPFHPSGYRRVHGIGRLDALAELTGLTDADGIGPGLVAEGNEAYALLGIFCEDEPCERGFVVDGEAEFILEDAIDLNLDSAIQPVSDINDDFESAIVEDAFKNARAGDGPLNIPVKQDESCGVFEVESAHVARFISASGMARDHVAGGTGGRVGDVFASSARRNCEHERGEAGESAAG
jgi:hypothetical protein